MLSQYAGLSILKLYEDGQTELQPHPILTPATGTTPPLPDWAWTPVEKDGFVHYARVVAPTRMRGSMPLAELPSRLHPATGELARFFLTARGTSAFGDTIYDVDVDIPVEGPEGYFTADLTLGGQQLATLHVTGGYVTLIEPSAFSFEHGLWTCHLARAALLASR